MCRRRPRSPERSRCASGDSTFLERLAIVGKEPVALLETYLSAAPTRGLADVSFAGSVPLRDVAGALRDVVTWAESVIDVTRCTSAEAGKLDVSVGEPLLRVEGTAFAEPKKPVEYFRVLYRANRVRFHLESRRKTDRVVRLVQDEGGRNTKASQSQPHSDGLGVA